MDDIIDNADKIQRNKKDIEINKQDISKNSDNILKLQQDSGPGKKDFKVQNKSCYVITS